MLQVVFADPQFHKVSVDSEIDQYPKLERWRKGRCSELGKDFVVAIVAAVIGPGTVVAGGQAAAE